MSHSKARDGLAADQGASLYIEPHFCLVVATLGRTGELQRLFHSLRAQTYKRFTVFVIDQNHDDRVIPIIQSLGQDLDVRHLRSEVGLSRARNVGVRMANGDVVAFPDDDCWYPPELLCRVAREFASDASIAAVGGWCADQNGDALLRRGSTRCDLDRFSVWQIVSTAVFIRKRALDEVGGFDESLGVGASTPYQSGEETDLLLRALARGQRLVFDPKISVFHPSWSHCSPEKARAYGRGFGRVLREHRYPLWFGIYAILRSLGGFALATTRLNFERARYYFNCCAGRVSGWLGVD